MNSFEIVEEDLKYITSTLKNEFNILNNNKILLTGGGGFLGYYLVKSIDYWNRLEYKNNIQVYIYDNFMRGYPEWLKALENNKYINIKKYNITEPLPLGIEDFDYIIHAASIASPIFYRKYPIETMSANVDGLKILLDYAKSQVEKGKPIKGFLYFSTSEIYGDPDVNNIPTSEEYRGNVSCTGPRACYDESKRFGETLCINYSKVFDLPIKIARPFNNYGPGLKISDRRALPDFARDVIANKDIILLSNGGPTRTFCYVADAIIGYYQMLLKGKNGESYNIGVENPEISILQLAQIVIEESNKLIKYNGKIVFEKSNDIEYLTDNPNRRCPSIKKARKDFGYSPKININDGIKRSMIWYIQNSTGMDR
jgi:UDP-glucuronate decarboxylase